jgi:hypothetical protein
MKVTMVALRVAAVSSVFAVGCQKSPALKHFTMPGPAQIKRIHVVIGATPERERVEFDVVDRFDEILNAFRENEEVPIAAAWKDNGQITIEAKEERLKIDLFDRSARRFKFKVRGTYYVGGSSQQLFDLLAKRAPKKKAG